LVEAGTVRHHRADVQDLLVVGGTPALRNYMDAPIAGKIGSNQQELHF
jgi:hypothetical protein